MDDDNIPDFLRKGAPARVIPGFGFGCSLAAIDPYVFVDAATARAHESTRHIDICTEIVDGQPRGFRITDPAQIEAIKSGGTMRGVSVGYIDGEKVVTPWVREQQRYKPKPEAVALALMTFDETIAAAGKHPTTVDRFNAMRDALAAAHGKD